MDETTFIRKVLVFGAIGDYLCLIQGRGGVGVDRVMVMARDFYQDAVLSERQSFNDKESRCRRVFQQAVSRYGGFWHLCTPGEGQAVIFRKQADYVFMMTAVAMCAHAFPDVRVITFEIMSNHIHLMLCGCPDRILAFFDMLKKRLKRYLAMSGEVVDLSHFSSGNLVAADSLESLRNQIVYINRNNYLVDPDQTPFSYPYGANGYYFMPGAKVCSDGVFRDLTIWEKRSFVHSRDIDYPGDWMTIGGYFSPSNYLALDIGEGSFRDARHYFHKVSRDIESYKEVASLLGEAVYYTDDELNAVIYRMCKRQYEADGPVLLPAHAKLELARTLHFDYHADKAKIGRLLKLPRSVLDQLFHP